MKKIASLLAAVMLLTATLAGCGNSGSGSSTTDTSSASSTASQSSAAEDSSAAEGDVYKRQGRRRLRCCLKRQRWRKAQPYPLSILPL